MRLKQDKVKFLVLGAPKESMVAKFSRSYFGGIMLKIGFTGFFLFLPQFSEFTLGNRQGQNKDMDSRCKRKTDKKKNTQSSPSEDL